MDVQQIHPNLLLSVHSPANSMSTMAGIPTKFASFSSMLAWDTHKLNHMIRDTHRTFIFHYSISLSSASSWEMSSSTLQSRMDFTPKLFILSMTGAILTGSCKQRPDHYRNISAYFYISSYKLSVESLFHEKTKQLLAKHGLAKFHQLKYAAIGEILLYNLKV